MSDSTRSTARPGPADLVDRLVEICGPSFARPAGPADEVAGRPASWVAVPGDTGAAARVMRLAAAHDLAIVPRGAGTKIDWGRAPGRVDIVLDTGRLAGIRHGLAGGEPAGVVEVGAGTPLRAAQAVLERTGRRLALDAPSPGATLGGVLAADEAGPTRLRYGAPGDQVVDLRYLTADGELVQAGGGESGRELIGLLCGSRGGPGVLVSAILRVQSLPARRAWVACPVWTPLEVPELVRAVLDAGLRPAAIELDLPAGPVAPAPRGAVPPVGSAPPHAGELVVLIEGGAADVGERVPRVVEVLGEGSTVRDSPPDWWRRYPFDPPDVALRVDVPAAHLHAAIYALRDAAGAPVPVRAAAALGVAYAVLPGTTPAGRVAAILTAVRQVLLARQGRCVVLAAPPDLRHTVGLWDGSPALPMPPSPSASVVAHHEDGDVVAGSLDREVDRRGA